MKFKFAKWCCTPEERQAEKPDRPYSLFEGEYNNSSQILLICRFSGDPEP